MRWIILSAALFGFLAVLVDAWATHSAHAFVDEQALGWLRLAADYQLWHALALLGVGILVGVRPGRFLFAAAIAFGIGIVLFAGGLYGLALTHARVFAVVVPIGGTALLAGWLLLAIYAVAQRPSR
jgi:uncharacterized membrane protein YgdD (TMEM256/DUF423 family)